MKTKFLLSLSLLFMVLGALFYINMKATETRKQVVEISENESRVIVFYRDDCADCRQIFPYLYARKLIYDDLILVNMNHEKNQKYIDQYSLKSVPTFVTGNKSYSGTKLEKIHNFIQLATRKKEELWNKKKAD
ncbi:MULTISPECIES: thioredoxin family protein [unclassified Enterococcus]|uniref:thioredoxin family protein n=1 Tax=unclassified Enterococcus TaxID=2608891 RepID=UPI003F28142E